MNHEAARRIAAASASLFLLAVFLIFVARNRHLAPSVDEVEYLHTALRMDRGERIFTDFAQHHSPLFFAMLMPLAPDEDGVAAMKNYVARARVLTLACSVVALLAAALIVWRASGRWYAPLILIALVLAAAALWTNGLGDVRAESPGLAFWWSGAALVLLARRGGWRGLGLGLIFIANLINPKWPVESAAVGVLFLVDGFRDRRVLLEATVAATLTALAGISALLLITDFDLFVVHVVKLSVALREHLESLPERIPMYPPWGRSPRQVRPLMIVPAAAVVALAWWRVKSAFASPKVVASLLVIAAAAFIELRFCYMWPVLDFRWYAMWLIAGAAVIALAPQSLAALIEPFAGSMRPLVRALPVGLAVLAIVGAVEMIPERRPEAELYWRRTEWLEARLQRGDTVWLDTWFHPIGARDASYYWFGFAEVLPVTMKFGEGERGMFPPDGDGDLPPCRIERGLDRTTRFLQRPYPRTPLARGCFDRLKERGAIEPTPIPKVWMVRR